MQAAGYRQASAILRTCIVGYLTITVADRNGEKKRKGSVDRQTLTNAIFEMAGAENGTAIDVRARSIVTAGGEGYSRV